MKIGFLVAGMSLSLGLAQAQYFPDPPDPAGPTILTRGQLPPPDIYMSEGLENYANGYVSMSAIRDTSLPYTTLTPQGSLVQDYGGWGGQLGGGFSIYHRLQHGLVWISYGGSYSRFNRSEFRNGTNQFLSAAYSKMLSRKWTLRASEGLIFSDNLGSTIALLPSSGFFPSTQPYSQKSFFNNTSASLGYQMNHHLSFFFGGDLFAAVYRPSQVAGYTGLSGNIGASYRFTRRTTLTGTYTLSHLDYSDSGVSSRVQTGTLTLSHSLTRRIEVGVSAGLSQVNSSGSTSFYFQDGSNTYFAQGIFKQETLLPNLTASIYRTGRRSRFGLSGGEGISGGNGLYLTSKNIFVNGTMNYQINPRLSINALVGYSRLKSVSNSTSNYDSLTYNGTIGYQVRRHIYANAAYSGWRFPQYGSITNYNSHRLTVGVTFATRDFPLPY